LSKRIKLKWLPTRSNAGEVIDKSHWGAGSETLYTCSRNPLFSDFSSFPDWKRTRSEDILLTRNGTPYVHLPKLGSIYSNVVQRVSLPSIHTAYIRYALEVEISQFRGYGVSIESLNYEMWGNIEVIIPPKDIQKEIAGFLDRETDRIDQLIKKKKSFVRLLQEKLQAFSYSATTKGVLNCKNFKSTDLTPLAQVPRDWEIIRIANIFSESTKMGGENLPILSVSINWGISDRELGDEDRHRIVNHIEDKNAYKHVKVGCLVYNMMRAWQGAYGVAKVEGLVSPAYVVAKPKRNLHASYFEYLLRTPLWIEEFRRASKGIADFRQRLYWENFRQIYVVLPPIEEQVLIVNEIEKKSQSIGNLVEKVKLSIEKLQELRTSLITEAVTGQLDIKSWKKRGSTDKCLDNIEEAMRT